MTFFSHVHAARESCRSIAGWDFRTPKGVQQKHRLSGAKGHQTSSWGVNLESLCRPSSPPEIRLFGVWIHFEWILPPIFPGKTMFGHQNWHVTQILPSNWNILGGNSHQIRAELVYYQIYRIRRPESAWLANILCRIQTVSMDPNPSPKSKIQNPKSEIQNPNGAVWGRHKKNED